MWLETLDYGAESCQQIVRTRLGFAIHPMTEKLSLSIRLVTGIREGYGSERRVNGIHLSSAYPRYSGSPTLTILSAIRLLGTFTFIQLFVSSDFLFFIGHHFE